MISIDDFKKTELKTAKVLTAEEIPGADRLWKLRIDVGGSEKEVVAGIKPFYTRESLVGRSVVVVNNLAPSVIRGVESAGMLLAAKHDGVLSLVTVDKDVPPGSVIG
jgi:methionyl-tRNA synthetase